MRNVKAGNFAKVKQEVTSKVTEILNEIVPSGKSIGDYRAAAKVANKILKCAYKHEPKGEIKKAPKQSRKGSGWIEHVKKVAAERGITYPQALKVAGESYRA